MTEVKAVPNAAESSAVSMAPRLDAQKAAQVAFQGAKAVAAQMGVNGRFVVGVMKTSDFLNLRGFGYNRDVSKRLKKAHLTGESTSEQQAVVSVVLTSEANGEAFYSQAEPMMIIDGHSRRAAWLRYYEGAKDAPKPPELVYVQFFSNLSDEEIIKEYNVFISNAGQGTTAERNDIQNKLNGFNPTSAFVVASWKQAFSVLGFAYEAGLKEFKTLLQLIDGWNIAPEKGKASTRRHVTGVKAAILDTFPGKEDCQQWEDFWLDFFAAETKGEKANKLRAFVKEKVGGGSDVVNSVYRESVKLYQAHIA